MYSLCESRLPPNLSFFNPVTPGPKKTQECPGCCFSDPKLLSHPLLRGHHPIPEPPGSLKIPTGRPTRRGGHQFNSATPFPENSSRGFARLMFTNPSVRFWACTNSNPWIASAPIGESCGYKYLWIRYFESSSTDLADGHRSGSLDS